MTLLDGTKTSNIIKENLKKEIDVLDKKPRLVVIQIGDNKASNSYIKSKEKSASFVGMNFSHIKLEKCISEEELIEKIKYLNIDNTVNGIILQLPVPKHIDSKKVINHIDPNKDVDGLTNINVGKLTSGNYTLVPCTALGVIELLKAYDIKINGKNVTIIGRSPLVGKPLISLFMNENATVTVCHSKTEKIKEKTMNADIIVVAIGKAKFLTEDMVKKDSVIIDVGINIIDGKLVGDTDFEKVKNKASYITPVPGGCGPMTVCMLIKNTLIAYHNLEKDLELEKMKHHLLTYERKNNQ